MKNNSKAVDIRIPPKISLAQWTPLIILPNIIAHPSTIERSFNALTFFSLFIKYFIKYAKLSGRVIPSIVWLEGYDASNPSFRITGL